MLLSNKPDNLSTIYNTQVDVKKHKLHRYAVAGRPIIFLSVYFTINYGLEDCYVVDLIALEPKIVI